MPEGTVRRGDIILISPFQNKLALLTLKGRDLMELFRNIAAVKGEGVSHEVALVVSKEGKLISARLNGKKIKNKKQQNEEIKKYNLNNSANEQKNDDYNIAYILPIYD